MRTKPSHGLLLGGTLCTGKITRFSLLHADLLLFTATANTSIVTLNLSLMINTVGFYQVPSPMHALALHGTLKACFLVPCLSQRDGSVPGPMFA